MQAYVCHPFFFGKFQKRLQVVEGSVDISSG